MLTSRTSNLPIHCDANHTQLPQLCLTVDNHSNSLTQQTQMLETTLKTIQNKPNLPNTSLQQMLIIYLKNNNNLHNLKLTQFHGNVMEFTNYDGYQQIYP